MSDLDVTSSDGIPADLETGWVAVTPVPVGKRCLAITHAPSGIAGIGEFECKVDRIRAHTLHSSTIPVPNTTLRSRVLGKSLMKPFPSSLPPHTVLDCILDDNWRANGILHILDVIKWKGQDIADCETPFRQAASPFGLKSTLTAFQILVARYTYVGATNISASQRNDVGRKSSLPVSIPSYPPLCSLSHRTNCIETSSYSHTTIPFRTLNTNRHPRPFKRGT